MRIAVFGSGYVGLVTGACLAEAGHQVVCVDIDATRIARLSQGVVPIFEPGLSELIIGNIGMGRLSFTTDAGSAIRESVLIFIAVGTPSTEDGSADLRHVLSVARTIGTHINGYKVVVDKSTVPVGTADLVTDMIHDVLERRGAQFPFDVCSNPEFLKEGNAIEDFSHAPRIIVGTDSDRVRDLMRLCYSGHDEEADTLIFMDVRAAELTKYAANAMLATKISFMNEIANLAERLGADVSQVQLGIGSDPRIGPFFIQPGAGFGGSCFPKDIRALARAATEVGYDAPLLTAVETVNRRQHDVLFNKLNTAFAGELEGRTIAVWGLAFKPNTDDMRDAPSRRLLERLWGAGAHVRAHDPEAMGEARRLYGDRADLELCASPEDAVRGADALVICTEWSCYRTADLAFLRQTLAFPIIVDGRNIFQPADVKRHGLVYYAIGRGDSLVDPLAAHGVAPYMAPHPVKGSIVAAE